MYSPSSVFQFERVQRTTGMECQEGLRQPRSSKCHIVLMRTALISSSLMCYADTFSSTLCVSSLSLISDIPISCLCVSSYFFPGLRACSPPSVISLHHLSTVFDTAKPFNQPLETGMCPVKICDPVVCICVHCVSMCRCCVTRSLSSSHISLPLSSHLSFSNTVLHNINQFNKPLGDWDVSSVTTMYQSQWSILLSVLPGLYTHFFVVSTSPALPLHTHNLSLSLSLSLSLYFTHSVRV